MDFHSEVGFFSRMNMRKVKIEGSRSSTDSMVVFVMFQLKSEATDFGRQRDAKSAYKAEKTIRFTYQYL
jgi:hypothetical protein